MGKMIVRCTQVSKEYASGELRPEALRGIDLALDAGAFATLLGSLGKTTGFELVGVLGPTLKLDDQVGAVSAQDRVVDTTATKAALLVRMFATLAHIDLSLQGSKVYGDLVALTASFPITPIWSTSCAVLWAVSDNSLLRAPGLKWSAAGELELLAGGLLGVGPRPRL